MVVCATRKMKHLLFCFLFFAAVLADESAKPALNSARILVSKHTLSQYAVENMDYVVQYDLYNVGDQAAREVVLDDRNAFPSQSFEVIKGLLQIRWDRINPGENVTHSVVLHPRSYGVFNVTSAIVSYYPTENAKETRIVYSTAPGEGYIYRQKDYERRFGSKISVWIIFLVLVAPSIALPYYLWNSINVAYPLIKKKN
uniref:Translocon-associated protein subunit beta n=1 Tax=Panagrolaimus sp. JU765 TaxID=591449 RepID=A0AC34RIK8_9BILA